MRLLKAFLIIIFSCIILAAAAVWITFRHYKSELTASVIEHLNEKFNVDLRTQRVSVSLISSWPRGAIQLHQVSATSHRFPDSHLKAGSIAISFNLRDLINKRFTVHSLVVRDGEIRFTRPQDSVDTAVRETPADTTDSGFELDIRRIHLQNTRLVYESPGPGQHFDLLFADNVIRMRTYTDGIDAQVKGKVHSSGLVFRENRGKFLDSAQIKLDVHVN